MMSPASMSWVYDASVDKDSHGSPVIVISSDYYRVLSASSH